MSCLTRVPLHRIRLSGWLQFTWMRIALFVLAHNPLQLPELLRTTGNVFQPDILQHPAEAFIDWSEGHLLLQDASFDSQDRGAEEAVLVDALQDTSRGQGMREGACVESVNFVDEIR